jgi:hypothetical protein
MRTFLDADIFTHMLAVLVLFSRLADVISTRLVTPTLRLEANPIVRRFGWRYALLTLLLCATPYFSRELAVSIFTVSFFAAGSNFLRGWVARAMGEEEFSTFMRSAVLRGNRNVSLAFVLAGAASYSIVGILLMIMSNSESEWGYWFGLGILLYGVAIALYGSLSIIRVFRSAGQGG